MQGKRGRQSCDDVMKIIQISCSRAISKGIDLVIDQNGKIINVDAFMNMRMGRIIGISAGHLNL